ncbi:RNA polymerase sigma-70 factor (ECF subfamily) [Sunxiuqinia elliptica]|uniref:RNA polymerase sigma-70 factor (ECF subfamily) n=2 Tax=Sunxiuqinia elliptica TaxID=655355 RepID=A0A4R6H7K3_9BACT|nr:RNA polymerase sigma-70 factor (ECF subfamily) [Sunxiuqinia elliptica]TDO62090.1 RNA polymerase sigma-70 factor (ECF subfamily) [Sunxiuqinia elliptica]
MRYMNGKEEIPMSLVWNQMKAGNEQGLSDLFTRLYPDLYLYGMKIFNLPDLVKDSIQDVFVRVWEKRKTLGEVLNPKAYLITALRRKLFENKERYFAADAEILIKISEKQAFSFVENEFTEIPEISEKLRESLIATINDLPERQRELVFLRFYYNLKYREIADILNVKEQTVKNLMQRTMGSLSSKLDRKQWERMDDLDGLLFTFFVFVKK